MNIKAIETKYKGYRFRSRLEARWAVFFDALGIDWRYECDGFEKKQEHEDAQGNITEHPGLRYLPDFFLPDYGTWAEVKPTNEALRVESDWMEEFLDYWSPLPNFTGSATATEVTYCKDKKRTFRKVFGLLFLGEIPDPTKCGLHLHPIVRHDKGLRWSWAFFRGQDVSILEHHALVQLSEVENDPNDWTVQSGFIPTERVYTKVVEAYRAARSARFEHGENG